MANNQQQALVTQEYLDDLRVRIFKVMEELQNLFGGYCEMEFHSYNHTKEAAIRSHAELLQKEALLEDLLRVESERLNHNGTFWSRSRNKEGMPVKITLFYKPECLPNEVKEEEEVDAQ
jgi:hypothetical protein